MNTSDQIFSFEDRVRRLPQDQGGSVLLLTGMMAFLATILSLFAMDTSQAIYNRIIAQNAVDGAAETGALWQARGLNMLQSLNNAHYIFNVGIYAAEWVCLAACDATPLSVAADYAACPLQCWPPGPACCTAAKEATYGLCTTCEQAGPLDDLQESVSKVILVWQGVISMTFPQLANIFASDVARASGADDLRTVLGQYNFPGGAWLKVAVQPLPTSPYAATMLPTSTSLDILGGELGLAKKVDGENWPWKWNQFGLPESVAKTAAEVSWNVGKVACGADIWQFGAFDGTFQDPNDWGWDDSYYQGVPGNMFWVAGKTNRTELAGLGFLRWMNGGAPPAEMHYSFMNQNNLQMYIGARLTSKQFMIPAFIAVACSQAEGSKFEVVAKDTGGWWDSLNVFDQPPVDSAPKLTTVFIPGTTTSASAPPFFIYH